jgi:PAS domain S-box-containing protein
MLNAQTIRVIVVDDDEDDYFIISDLIREIENRKFVVDWCNNYNTALEKIKAKHYDICLVDYRLGSHTGLQLLQEARSTGFDGPIVMLTGKGNKEVDIKAMQSGATDYLVKSELNTEKLERCIRYSIDRAASLQELKTRENKYRILFEHSKDAVFIADEYLALKEINHAASLLFFGNNPPIGVPVTLYDVIRNENSKTKIRELSKGQRSFNDFEIEIEGHEREKKTCLLSLSFLFDHDGEKIVHGILHDITNIKRAELANLQSQKLALNERVMRTLAHEIRNPLNNIILSIEHLFLPETDAGMQHNLVDIMQRNCGRIKNIITELLDLTKAPDLTFQVYTLQEVLEESIAMTLDRINLQQVLLQKKFPDLPLEVSANKAKLTIAFTNIILNAVEAMETGKGELMVSIATSASHYTITISDNGSGIPEEYISKLFEPFFTLKKNGVGLGLAAAHSIFQSHNARVEVESRINKGTDFRIHFDKELLIAESNA